MPSFTPPSPRVALREWRVTPHVGAQAVSKRVSPGVPRGLDSARGRTRPRAAYLLRPWPPLMRCADHWQGRGGDGEIRFPAPAGVCADR